MCKENKIQFISLPPNTADKTQPLDVAYFRPIKMAWKKFSMNGSTLSKG